LLNLNNFYSELNKSGISFFTGVPDSLLNDFCLYLNERLSYEENVITANEGNAIAVASGYHIATGNLPLVYMQNSGIGNSINPLISLTNKETYSIPMILLIGWRGSPDINDWAHHMKQGKETPILMGVLDIPYRVLENDEDSMAETVQWASDTAKKISGPVALLVKKGTLEKGNKKNLLDEVSEFTLSREEAIELIIDSMPDDTIYVATTGRATREIYEIRNKSTKVHKNDFLNVGAMGHASSIALGLAIGNPERQVVCLDGDAAALMHMGSFAIIGNSVRSNLLHIVLNNGVHESVGGQPSVGQLIDFTGVARSSGYSTLGKPVSEKHEIQDAIRKLSNESKPRFIDVRIKKGIRKDIPNLKVSLLNIKNDLMNNLNEKL